jgi:hypothetical protein
MNRTLSLVLFLIVAFSAGAWDGILASAEANGRRATAAPTSSDIVSAAGNEILLNGNPFVSKGVIFGFPLMPVHLLGMVPESEDVARYIADRKEARDYYFGQGPYFGRGALRVLKNWDINTIRLNLYDGSLDPLSPLYSEAYVTDVIKMVAHARSEGFIVIATLFDGGKTSSKRPSILSIVSPGRPLATAMTQRAFAKLAQMFKNDRGVILEPINEPYSPVKHVNGWQYWLNGGVDEGVTYIGMNELIRTARVAGARNLIVAQGIGGTFLEYPGGLVDSTNEVGYSVHPFFSHGTTEAQWNDNFGHLAIAKPVILTAWNADARDPWCTPTNINLPRRFFNYLEEKNLGLVGYGFDFKGTIVKNYQGKPTQWPNRCGEDGGPGQLLKNYFGSSP